MDTEQIDEWSLEMCRDWLAIKAGWKKHGSEFDTGAGTPWPQDSGEHKVKLDGWNRISGFGIEHFYGDHPIPETLCEAAKLPEGWQIEIFELDNGVVQSTAWSKKWREHCRKWASKCADYVGPKNEIAFADSELLARFRLRVKVESATSERIEDECEGS